MHFCYVPTAVVVFFAVDVVLDGGVSTDALALAQGLAVLRAVDISDNNLGVAVVLAVELVEGGLHALAVSAPRSKELDDAVLSLKGGVEGLGGELRRFGAGDSSHGTKDEGGDLHDGGSGGAVERSTKLGEKEKKKKKKRRWG